MVACMFECVKINMVALLMSDEQFCSGIPEDEKSPSPGVTLVTYLDSSSSYLA